MAEAARAPAMVKPVKVRVIVRARAYTPHELEQFRKTHLERFLKEMGLQDFLDDFKSHKVYNDPSTWENAFSEDSSKLKSAFPKLTNQDCAMFKDFLATHDLEMRMDPARSSEELTRVHPDENSNMIQVKNVGGENATYEFDKILGPTTSQPELFHFVGVRVCDNAIRGGKGCVVAFGPTGSGKTHCMEGVRPLGDANNQGVVIQSVDYILKQVKSLAFIKSANISIQCIEIFARASRDLIEPFSEKGAGDEFKAIQIQEQDLGDDDLIDAITVNFKGASNRKINNTKEAIALMNLTAANRMKNDWNKSGCTRSHCLYKIHVNTERANGQKCHGSMLLMDLAGSETLGEEFVNGLTSHQVDSLNLSLNTVCRVIEGIRNPEDFALIPFKDHILALSLKDYLTPGSDVHLLLTVFPHYNHTQQTMKTLDFGARARGLKTSTENQAEEGVLKPVKLFRRTTAEAERDDFGAKWVQNAGGAPPPMFRA